MKKLSTIAVASGKGGTGKTLISTSLAMAIAQTRKVVLVDLDVEEPNTHIFFPKGNDAVVENVFRNVPRPLKMCSGCRACASLCQFGAIAVVGKKVLVFPELCHGCHLCVDMCKEQALEMTPHLTGTMSVWHSQKLSHVEGRLVLGEESGTHLIQTVRKQVDTQFSDTIKVIDCPPGTSCHVIESLRNTDFVVLVTEPTPFGTHDLGLALELCKRLSVPAGVIVNRDGIGNSDVQSLCATHSVPIIARIPENSCIASSYAEGIHPLSISFELQQGTQLLRNFVMQKALGGAQL